MIKDVLAEYKQGDKEIKGKIEFSFHDDPTINAPYFHIKGQYAWINLAVSCEHPTPI